MNTIQGSGSAFRADLASEPEDTKPTTAKLPTKLDSFVSPEVADKYAASQQMTPSSGANEATRGQQAGYADPNADLPSVIEDRLKSDPDYQEALRRLNETSTLENDFTLVDRHTGIGPDSRIEYANLVALVNDKNADPAARAAARRLLDNTELWNAIAKGDQWVGIHDVQGLIAERKAAEKSLRESITAQVKAERGIGTPGAGGSNGTPSTDGTPSKESPENADATSGSTPTPKPQPSTLPGTEGALENLANGQDWIQKEIERLSNEAAADPSKAPALQAKISMLQNQFQVLANLTNQLTQMMSNLTKMWSDIAMNSVRNMK